MSNPENLQRPPAPPAMPRVKPARPDYETMLRDEFAGLALQAIMSQPDATIDIDGKVMGEQRAGAAYLLADAMMHVRSRENRPDAPEPAAYYDGSLRPPVEVIVAVQKVTSYLNRHDSTGLGRIGGLGYVTKFLDEIDSLKRRLKTAEALIASGGRGAS